MNESIPAWWHAVTFTVTEKKTKIIQNLLVKKVKSQSIESSRICGCFHTSALNISLLFMSTLVHVLRRSSPLIANYGQTGQRKKSESIIWFCERCDWALCQGHPFKPAVSLPPGSKMMLQRQRLFPTHPSIHHCRHTAAKNDWLKVI